MTYPGFGAYGAYRGQMPMQMAVGQSVPGGVPSVAHGGSPGYSVYSGAYAAAAAADPLWTFFSAIAGQDGEVDAEDLQRCLTQSGISGTYSPFSLETCRIMISMLDRENTGKMGYNEFKELWAALNAWKQNFMMIDQDRSGPLHLPMSQDPAGLMQGPHLKNILKIWCFRQGSQACGPPGEAWGWPKADQRSFREWQSPAFHEMGKLLQLHLG